MIASCGNSPQHRRAQQHRLLGIGDRNRHIRRVGQKLSHKIALRSTAARNDQYPISMPSSRQRFQKLFEAVADAAEAGNVERNQVGNVGLKPDAGDDRTRVGIGMR